MSNRRGCPILVSKIAREEVYFATKTATIKCITILWRTTRGVASHFDGYSYNVILTVYIVNIHKLHSNVCKQFQR